MEHRSRLSRSIPTAWGLQRELGQSANVPSRDREGVKSLLPARVLDGVPPMQAPLKMFLTVLGASAAFFLALAIADTATAAGCGCTPPPTCCAPPTPPTPPSTPCCQPPGHTVNIPGIEINV